MRLNSIPAVLFLIVSCAFIRGTSGFIDQPNIATNTSASISSHLLIVDEKIFQLDKVIKQLQSNVANVDSSIGHVQQALAEKDRIIEDLENMVGEFEKELRNASKRQDQLEKENDALKNTTKEVEYLKGIGLQRLCLTSEDGDWRD